MTIYAMCSVRDVVASTFGRPIFAPNTASAVRSIQNEVNRPQDGNMLNTHPDDFELYHLGNYDDQTGGVEMLPQPQLLVRCSNLVNRND